MCVDEGGIDESAERRRRLLEDPEVQEVIAGIQRGIQEFLDQTPEENLAQFRASMIEWCEEQNARPLEDRVRTLAAMYDADAEGALASIDDVEFRWQDPDADEPEDVGGVTVNVRLKRSIEQVYFTATVGGAGGCLTC